MVSIYNSMKENWETYCLMSGIALIEEMTKPYPNKQHKGNKDFECFVSVQLFGISKFIIQKWFEITKYWEEKLNTKFIGPSFDKIKKDNYGKWHFGLLPNWLYYIFKTTGKLPSKHTNNVCFYRLKNWRNCYYTSKQEKYLLENSELLNIENKKSLYPKLFEDKSLAAGAFIVSFDFEFRGVTTGNPSLCMSDTYKDFLEFMLAVANKWEWATLDYLSSVDVSFSRKRGIDATDQHDFRIKKTRIEDIYNLAGPLADEFKEKCIKHHIYRMNAPKDYHAYGATREKLLKALKKLKRSTTTELQFYVTVGHDVILDNLNILEKQALISKERVGKKYYWSIKNAS